MSGPGRRRRRAPVAATGAGADRRRRPGRDDRRRRRPATVPVMPRAPRAPTARRARPPGRSAGRPGRPGVRRRRRVVAAVGGVLLLLVLAFALWYELESHALGPEGPQVVITVHQGESTDSDRRRAEPTARDRQLAGLPDLGPLPRSADRAARGLRAAPEPDLRAGPGPSWPPGPTSTPVDVRPGFTLCRGGRAGRQPAGPRPGRLRRRSRPAGRCTRPSRRPGSNNLEGMLGTGHYLVLPGETDVTMLRAMVQRFDQDAQAAGLSTASAAALGLTPYQVIIAASVVEKEGYIPSTCPTWHGSSTTAWPRTRPCRWIPPSSTRSARTAVR